MVPQYSEGAVQALLKLNRRCLCLRPQERRPLSSTCRPRDAGASVPAIEAHNGRRQYSTTNFGQPNNIAVLGGGLTGLTTAWYLTRFMPTAKVTIYEGSGRLGGWIDTETVEVKGERGQKGTIRFERGARMVKPYALSKWDDVAFYELVDGLNLQAQVWAKEREPNRFIYYPDHLVSLPSGTDFSLSYQTLPKIISNAAAALQMTLTEPLFKKLYPTLYNAWRRKDGFHIWRDEMSVGDYFLDMFGGHREVVDNVLSAMMHGVYGGDVWKLGMASNSMMTPGLRRGAFPKDPKYSPIQMQDWRLLKEIQGTPTARIMLRCGPKKALGFREGFGTLVDALVKSLTANPNVKVVSQPVRKVQLLPNGKMEISAKKLHSTAAMYKTSHDKVISTIYSKTLSTLTPPNTLPSLAATTAVSIRLVNLWSPRPNLNFPHNGFGYLLPQTVPLEQNPHAALGVIFDSDLKPPGSTPDTPSYGDTVPGTKITVMLGGHHWSDLPPAYLPDAYTSDSAAIAAAKETVALQLGIPPEAWTVASTKLCKDCIPQQLVGHTKLMAQANRELFAAFDGKLAVCGGSYTAPGVPSSLRAARDVAAQVAGRLTVRSGHEMEDSVGVTGLARFVGDPRRFWGMESGEWMSGFRKEKEKEEE